MQQQQPARRPAPSHRACSQPRRGARREMQFRPPLSAASGDAGKLRLPRCAAGEALRSATAALEGRGAQLCAAALPTPRRRGAGPRWGGGGSGWLVRGRPRSSPAARPLGFEMRAFGGAVPPKRWRYREERAFQLSESYTRAALTQSLLIAQPLR